MSIDDDLTVIHRKAAAHLVACTEAFYADQDGEEDVESPAAAPFCGCDDCIVREVLVVAWRDLVTAAVCYIEENARDQEAINQIYGRALARIASGEAEDPATLARLTLGEAN